MSAPRIAVFGATGYTGRRICAYLSQAYPDCHLTLAGRSEGRLRALQDQLAHPARSSTCIADACDVETLRQLAISVDVVIGAAGPYTQFGSGLVEACVLAGSNYVDLCGEPPWMRRMIRQYERAARASGARIIFSCGFDSIPFDLGANAVQQHFRRLFDRLPERIDVRVLEMRGGYSAGTAASLNGSYLSGDGRALLNDPYFLAQGAAQAVQPDWLTCFPDPLTGRWAAPFIMAPINRANIHRTNALLGYAYGEGLVYSEYLTTGTRDEAEAQCERMEKVVCLDGLPPPKTSKVAPAPDRQGHGYRIRVWASDRKARTNLVLSSADDPGYGSTAKLVVEAAMLVTSGDCHVPGGFWTPASAFGHPLWQRLIERDVFAVVMDACDRSTQMEQADE